MFEIILPFPYLGTGLFGSKPATTAPFGTSTSLFGAGAATSTFGATSTAGLCSDGQVGAIDVKDILFPCFYGLHQSPCCFSFSISGTGIFGNTALGQTAAAKPAFNFSLGSTPAGAAQPGTGLFGTTQTGMFLLC